MTSPFTDLGRPPLRVAALRRALLGPESLWSGLDVVEVTGSTNADLVAAAAGGAAEGRVLVAELQRSGRGRLARSWEAPARSGLTFSVLLRPPPATRASRGWLPLLAGLAVADALRRHAEVEAEVKWPNDVLVEGRKLAGVLAEAAGDAVVVGVGLNVSLRAEELPVPTATSLTLAGAALTDRDTVLRVVLRSLAEAYRAWVAAGGDVAAAGLLARYRERCATLGAEVTVALPDGSVLAGRALDVDAEGHLLVETPTGVRTLAAGDVVHVRPA